MCRNFKVPMIDSFVEISILLGINFAYMKKVEVKAFKDFLQQRNVLTIFEDTVRGMRCMQANASLKHIYTALPVTIPFHGALSPYMEVAKEPFSKDFWNDLEDKWVKHYGEIREGLLYPKPMNKSSEEVKYVLENSGRLYYSEEDGEFKFVKAASHIWIDDCFHLLSGKYISNIQYKDFENALAIVFKGEHLTFENCKRAFDEYFKGKTNTDVILTKNKNMEDFTFYDFNSNGVGIRTKLNSKEIAVNCKKSNYSVTFNQITSKEILDGSFITYRVREDNITGALHFVFTKDNTIGSKFCATGSSKNVLISSKKLVEFLKSKFKLEGQERYILQISPNCSHSEMYYTVKIENKHD